MTTNKSTKRALLSSALALLVCFAMLLGTTFAWFTDEVTSSANKIVSGTLKVDLELLDKDTNAWASIKNNKAPLFNYDKWEPGFIDAKVLKVENEGTLALKWKAKFVSAVELSELADVIDVYVLAWGVRADDNVEDVKYPENRDLTAANYVRVGTVREFVNTIESTTYGNLLKGESAYLGIALKMQESAGNTYQEKTLGAFDIQIVATQMASETDNFGNDYDAGAEFDGEISNAVGLAAACKNGGTYKLLANITITEPVEVAEGVTVVLNTNGYSISNTGEGNAIVNNGTLTIDGVAVATAAYSRRLAAANAISATSTYAIKNNGTMKMDNVSVNGIYNVGALEVNGGEITNNIDGCHAIYNENAKLVINGGNVSNSIGSAIVANGSTEATINGGSFTGTITVNSGASMEIKDGEFKNSGITSENVGGDLIISGGTTDFDPDEFLSDDCYQVESDDGYIVVDKELVLYKDVLHNDMAGLYIEKGNTTENKYYVSSAAGLENLNKIMADGSAGKEAKITLLADIDFTGKTWTTVDSHADTDFYFNEIDGAGHTIYNLTINGQAMFKRFSGFGDVVIKNLTFDGAVVNSNGAINTSILTIQSYQNVLLDNVDVKNSTITGGYKVAPLIATVYNENDSTVTATLKNCDVENVVVTATVYDFCTTGMVAFVNAGNNDKIEFENCTVTNVKLYAPDDGYKAHASVYTTGSGSLFNEVEGVTVTNVTFEALN